MTLDPNKQVAQALFYYYSQILNVQLNCDIRSKRKIMRKELYLSETIVLIIARLVHGEPIVPLCHDDINGSLRSKLGD